MHMQNY
jgi:hypothetical protein